MIKIFPLFQQGFRLWKQGAFCDFIGCACLHGFGKSLKTFLPGGFAGDQFPELPELFPFLEQPDSFPVRLGVFQKFDFVHRAFEVHPFVVESRQTPADHHRRTGFDRTEIFRFNRPDFHSVQINRQFFLIIDKSKVIPFVVVQFPRMRITVINPSFGSGQLIPAEAAPSAGDKKAVAVAHGRETVRAGLRLEPECRRHLLPGLYLRRKCQFKKFTVAVEMCTAADNSFCRRRIAAQFLPVDRRPQKILRIVEKPFSRNLFPVIAGECNTGESNEECR